LLTLSIGGKPRETSTVNHRGISKKSRRLCAWSKCVVRNSAEATANLSLLQGVEKGRLEGDSEIIKKLADFVKEDIP